MSKLKWDLTAITPYDYLDFMINAVDSNTTVDSRTPSSSPEVRKNSEKLVTLCATDESFLTFSPSLIAASALVTAIEQDSNPNFNIHQIVLNLQNVASKMDLSTLKNCMSLIDRIFLQGENSEDLRYADSYGNLNQGQNRTRNRNLRSENETTPTEVFSVLASCVT